MARPTIPCQKWKLPEKYEIRELIGTGSFGSVCEAVDREKKQLVAIKRINYIFDDLSAARKVLRDLAILSELNHEHILQIHAIVTDLDIHSFERIYAITELCDSNLKQLCSLHTTLMPQHISALLYNLLTGVNYLHSAGIVHCDLKPAECLVNQDCSVKISDFKSARVLDAEHGRAHGTLKAPRNVENEPSLTVPRTSPLTRQNHRSVLPTLLYYSPELLLMQEAITAATDMWSVGCIYAELIGMLPSTPVMDRRPLFPDSPPTPPSPARQCGFKHYRTIYHGQITAIFRVLGSPNEDLLQWLDCAAAKRYVKSIGVQDGEGLASQFSQVNADSLAMLGELLQFVPAARTSAREALDHPMFAGTRDPTKEVLAAHRLQFDFLRGPDLDKELLRKYLHKEIEAFPRRDYCVTLHVGELTTSCASLVFTNMAGEDLLVNIPDPQRVTFAEVRQKVLEHLEIRASYLTLLLPCGRRLGNAENSAPLYNLLSTWSAQAEEDPK